MYASLTDLTAYLGIDESTADDGLLAQFLARAQAAIDNTCHRTFEASADTTRHYDYRSVDGYTLYLDADLCAITSVVNGDGNTISAALYTTEPRNMTPWYALRLRDRLGLVWDGYTDDIAITGKFAYSVSAPAPVQQATIRLAAWLYRQKDNTGNDAPIIAGDVTILPARLPSDVYELLESEYIRRLT